MTAPAILLMGPTAAGKTDLALHLALQHGYEIISVDSAMVYRGMDIGTAKPDIATLARAPHWLINLLDPAQCYSAARFVEDALTAMRAIRSRGKVPLLVGGTFLYFRALTQGLSPLPAADPKLREELAQQHTKMGLAALHQRLAKLDPPSAARIHRNDSQRILRALEVCLISGQPLSHLQQSAQAPLEQNAYCTIALLPTERAWLHQRIALRFAQMLETGFLEEVAALRQRPDLNLNCPSMRAVGYRQAWQALDESWSSPQLLERGIVATRQYARRQLTWLRHQVCATTVLDPAAPHPEQRLVETLRQQRVLP